ncbi:hypothetical protein H0H87_008350 [Tephrocybe sp. NHM501043]|nr:hypothetical protein H0H87_008350 [Tephrocybe sp. NHM501043]
MRGPPTILAVLGVSFHAAAQDSSSLVNTLQGAGLTSLASAVQRANGTQAGQGLLNQLSSGNHTLFAPNNQAFDAPGVFAATNNSETLANILAYHILPGNFVNSSMNSSALDSGVLPNVTLGHTLLTNSSLVQLEGNKPQVVAWSRNDSNGQIYFLNQRPQVNVVNTTNVGNILVATVNGVLIPPGNITSVLEQNNLTAVNGLLNMVNVPGFFPNGTNATAGTVLDANSTHGYTLFAPTNEAVEKAGSSLSSFSNNQTALLALLGNHYVNGTSYYSPQLQSVNGNSSNFVSAAGQPFNFNTNSSGTFVTSGNGASAKIVKSDLLTENGVVHVVDNVLVNTQSDPSRASAAYASATSVAAQSSTQTGPIGGLSTSTSNSNSTSNRTSDASSVHAVSAWATLLVGTFGWATVMLLWA